MINVEHQETGVLMQCSKCYCFNCICDEEENEK